MATLLVKGEGGKWYDASIPTRRGLLREVPKRCLEWMRLLLRNSWKQQIGFSTSGSTVLIVRSVERVEVNDTARVG